MKKTIPQLFFCSFAGLTLTSCSHKEKNIDNWIGNYSYEETPVKANAGYSMVMEWSLAITKIDDTLEINGQQTDIEILTKIEGDTNTIAVIYDSILTIGYVDATYKKGDTLFTLSKAKNGTLTTNWIAIKPFLSDNPPKECSCFFQTK